MLGAWWSNTLVLSYRTSSNYKMAFIVESKKVSVARFKKC